MGQFFIPQKTTAVQGIPQGKLDNLDRRVSALESEGNGGGSGPHTHPTSDITLPKLPGATIGTLDVLDDYTHSTISLSGGDFGSNGNGTISVASGNGQLRATNSDTASLLQVKWNTVASLSLTDEMVNFIYLEYNGGSPQVVADTTERTDYNTNIFLGTVYREGNVTRLYGAKRLYGGNHSSLIARRLQKTQPFARESGAVLGETGTRNISVTAGVFWEGVDRFTTSAFDSSASGTFTYYYRSATPSVFTRVTGQTQISNTQYDDGSGTLATLTNNNYTNAWVYLGAASAVYVVYGRVNAPNVAGAENAPAPNTLPDVIVKQARLIGRIIIQQGASSFVQVDSAFNQMFTTTGITNHNDTANKQGGTTGEFYHLTQDAHSTISNIDQGLLLGRGFDGTGSVQQISLGDGLTMNGSVLKAEGSRWTQVNSNIYRESKVGIQTGNADPTFDLQVGEGVVVNPPTGLYASIDYGSGNYTTNPYSYYAPFTFSYRLYTYKSFSGTRVYSKTFKEFTVVTYDYAYSSTSFNINVVWDAVSDIDGYKLIFQNDYNGYAFGDAGLETTSTTYNDDNVSYPDDGVASPNATDPAFFVDKTTGRVGMGTTETLGQVSVKHSSSTIPTLGLQNDGTYGAAISLDSRGSGDSGKLWEVLSVAHGDPSLPAGAYVLRTSGMVSFVLAQNNYAGFGGVTTPLAPIHSRRGVGTFSPITDEAMILQRNQSSSDNCVLTIVAGATGGSANGSSIIRFASTASVEGGRIFYNHQNNYLQFYTNSAESFRIDSTRRMGLGTSVPTAYLHIRAGASGAGLAPLKLTSGPLNTTPEAGAVEFLTDRLTVTGTTGATRKDVHMMSYRAITSARTLDGSDELVNCTSGTFAVTLPTAVGFTREYTVYNSGAGTITINTTSSQTVSGSGSGVRTLAQHKSFTFRSDGANWIITASF